MSQTPEKITVLLDWFINPNHAPLLVADWTGAFAERGLTLELVASDDPSQPPHLLAEGKGDLAINYQPELYFLRRDGLPVVRVGGLIPSPLATLAVLKESGITSLSGLRGRKVGCAVTGVDGAILTAMLRDEGMTLSDLELVNVGFDLVGALLNGSVDAVVGGYRTFEAAEIRARGGEAIMFNVEDHSIPAYEELIFISREENAHDPRIGLFLEAVEAGVAYLSENPEECWSRFVSAYPDLDNAINRDAWEATLPLFARKPSAFSLERYEEYGSFLVTTGLLDKPISVKSLLASAT